MAKRYTRHMSLITLCAMVCGVEQIAIEQPLRQPTKAFKEATFPEGAKYVGPTKV